MTPVTFVRSVEEFSSCVVLGETRESRVLEFKSDYAERSIPKGAATRDQHRREGRKECARDIAQFANTDGGCLLIGIDEGVDSSGAHIAARISPIADVDDLRRWIEGAVAEFLIPSTFSFELTEIPVAGGRLLAVNIPAYRHLVSVWDRQSHTAEFLRRTSQGKAWMNPDEMERHLMNGSRAAYLTFSHVISRAPSPHIVLVDGYWVQHGMYGTPLQPLTTAGPAQLTSRNDESFTLSVPLEYGNHTIEIPYSLIEHTWLDANRRTNVMLSCRLVLTGQIFQITSRG
ncbi:MAG: helix-turn-helix domain-containing protein [Nitrospirota bacterium]